MTFYDNHDMTRIDADDNGFIDANNWLFTSRGVPVVYYGSEIGFRAGLDEHEGNRDYFGQENVDRASSHPIHAALKRVANVRKNSLALQRGLQVNMDFLGRTAAFYRVYQKGDVTQTALVLLNGGDEPHDFLVSQWLTPGKWRDAFTGEAREVAATGPELAATVAPHDVGVFLLDGVVTDPQLIEKLDYLQSTARRRTLE
jgi:cyclomaltodextrin glucanotransferase